MRVKKLQLQNRRKSLFPYSTYVKSVLTILCSGMENLKHKKQQ